MTKKPIKSFKNFSKKDRRGHLSWGAGDVTITRNDRKIELDPAKKKKTGKRGPNYPVKVYEDAANFKEKSGLNYADAKIDSEHEGYVHKLPDAEHLNQVAHKDSFTPDMTKAAGAYKSWSPSFNDHLRGVDPRRSDYAANPHERLDDMKAVTSRKTIHPFTAYRGFDHAVPIHKAEVGDVIHDKGFTGTSLDKSVAHAFSKHKLEDHSTTFKHLKYPHDSGPWGAGGDTDPKIVAKINIPAGTKGHHLDIDHGHYHGLEKEREFVLHPGTKFKVTGHSKHIDERGFRYHFIHMDVHHQED